MNIYIEYVLINNFSVDLMILYLTSAMLRHRVKWFRLILASMIGTVYAVLLPYISFKGDICIKILLALLMVYVGCTCDNVKDYGINVLIFFSVTFLFGGVVIGIGNMFVYDYFNMLIYPNSLLASCISLVILTLAVLCRYLYHLIFLRMHRTSNYYDVNVMIGNEHIGVKGYLDTGNRLYYHLSRVIVFDSATMDMLSLDTIAEPQYLNVCTINSEDKTKIYKLDNVELVQNGIHRNYKNIYAMRSNRRFKDYQVLLHADM